LPATGISRTNLISTFPRPIGLCELCVGASLTDARDPLRRRPDNEEWMNKSVSKTPTGKHIDVFLRPSRAVTLIVPWLTSRQ
jgi:hypothetical protein